MATTDDLRAMAIAWGWRPDVAQLMREADALRAQLATVTRERDEARALLSATRPIRFIIYKAKDGYRWHAKRNGRIVAESGEA